MPDEVSREGERLAPAPPVPESAGLRRLVGHAAIDVGPLRRHRDFRLLFAGQAVSYFGSMITFVAIPFQVYDLTGSSLLVGLLGIAELAPLLVTALVGGALADAHDRRRLVRLAELGLAMAAGLLLVNALLPSPQVWVLFVVASLMAALDGIQRPSLDALTPRLVLREELAAASALEGLRGTIGRIAGPAVGGLVIAGAGIPATYGIDMATFAFSLAMLTLMRAVPPPPDAEPPSLRRIVEGLRYAASREELFGTYAVDLTAMFFGMPAALFPALADKFGGATALGFLYAALSVGSLLATLTSGWIVRVHRHGLAVVFAAAAWGIAIVALGFAPTLGVALAALAAAGFADMVSGMFRQTIWNQTIPDRLRGRLAGIEQLSYSAGPLLGNVESGLIASLAGLRASIVSGGVLCVAGVAVAALALPGLRAYDARRAGPEPEPAAA
ncbi:MAG TPA: MFS transporter [Gaiellaceae bacterium]